MNVSDFESNVDYQTKLSGCDFEGPLDLLLFLIKRAEIDVKDIFVSEVTDQFLEYVSSHRIDIGTESEYLSIAATIIQIKSKAVIPNEEVQVEVEEQKTDLFRRIEEYRLIKESAVKLKELETTDRFYKAPDESAGEVVVKYTDFNIDGLIKAFMNVYMRSSVKEAASKTTKVIPKEVYTVTDKIYFIRDALTERRTMSFYELFNDFTNRSELVTTFQAMLELLKLQVISAEQDDTFGDITLTILNEGSVDIEKIDEYN